MSALPPPAAPVRSPLRRYLVIGVPLFLAAGAFYLWAWPRIETSLVINGLGTEDPEAARDLRKRLRARGDAATDQALLDAVADEDRPFRVRQICVDLLLERNRLTALEDLARRGDRPTRSVIFDRLAKESFFKTEILPEPAYRVVETVQEWLADRGSEGRDRAIALALHLDVPDAMEHIRPLLSREAAEGAGRRAASDTLVGAVSAVEHYKDCASVERVAAVADGDPDIHVRMRVWDVLERLALGMGDVPAVCPGSLAPERVAAILSKMVHAPGQESFDRSLRMKACAVIERHPAFLPPLAERVRAILSGVGSGADRRAALATLVAGKDAVTSPELPRYFHDRDFEVRSTAVQVADRVEGMAVAALWIGTLRDESQSLDGVRQAHQRLRLAAGREIGLPKEIKEMLATPDAQQQAVLGFVEEQFRGGSSHGLTREAWSDAWFRWFLGSKGLGDADVESAVAARRAFRAAMDKGDAVAGRAALAGAPAGAAGLFLYEEGWLASRP